MADRVISYLFRGDFRNFTAGLTAAGRGVQDFGGRLTALDRDGERMRRGLNTVGDTAGKIGLAAAAGLGAVITVTAKFESAMARVSAATGSTGSEFKALRDAAIKAGADTVFSASEAADGITELAKAGVSAKDVLGGGLSGALDLAAAGQISVADAAATTAITLQQFSLDGSQATRVADTLAKGAASAVGGVQDMSQALQYVGPVAAQMGLSLEETTGAISEMAAAGILGSSSGTALRGILTSLTSPSKQAALTMEGLGISMYDAQGEFVGLDGIAGQLKSSMTNLTAADRDQALGRIFGNEQITAARILYSGGAEDVRKWTKEVTDSGFAAEQAAKLTDTLAGDVEQLKGSLETALIETGSSSQGGLRAVVQSLTDVVNGYSDLPGPAKTAAGAALALTAAIGGGTFVFAKAVGGLASMQTSLTQMGVSAERAATSTKVLGRVATGAAGVGLLAAGLATTNKEMRALETTAGGAAIGFSVGGPWGAAVGGAIGLVVGLATSHDRAAEAVKNLSSTFDVETGAITENTRVQTALALQSDGLFNTFESLGISTQLVTDAVMGAAGAQEQLNAQIASADYRTLTTSLADLKAKYGDTQGELTFAQEQEAAKQKVAGLSAEIKTQAGLFGEQSEKAKQLAGAVAGAGTAQFQTAEQVQATAKALADARKSAEDAARGFVNLGDSVSDAKVSLGDWITELEEQNKALANFERNSIKAANNGVRKGLIRALQDLGPEGALRLGQLADATNKEVGRANRAYGAGEKQVNKYADAITAVPSAKATTLTANAGGALDQVNRLQNAIAALRDKTITVRQVTQLVTFGVAGGDKKRAGGGAVYGPGSSTSDSIPAALSNGEYVVQTKAVNKYGTAMMDAINQQRFATGGLVGFATGGEADTKKARPQRLGFLDLPDGYDGIPKGGFPALLKAMQGDLKGLRRGIKESEAAIDAQTDAVDLQKTATDNATQALEGLQGQFSTLASSIKGLFSSDLFAQTGDAFSSNTTSDPISVLMSDIANSQEFSGLFAGLQGRGLDGAALTAGAQGGTSALQTLAAYSDEQLQRYEDLFNQREQLGASTGQQVAQAQYGQAVAAATVEAARQTAELATANAQLATIQATLAAQQAQQAQTTKATEKVQDAVKDNAKAVAKGKRSRK